MTLSKSFKIAILIATLLLIAGVIVPFMIKVACYALLFVFDHPLIMAVSAISFITGMLIGETK